MFTSPLRIAYTTSSAVLWMPSASMMLARCTATVLTLRLRCVGDLLVRFAVHNQLQDLEFPRGEPAVAFAFQRPSGAPLADRARSRPRPLVGWPPANRGQRRFSGRNRARPLRAPAAPGFLPSACSTSGWPAPADVSRIFRVAVRPLIFGRAQSITTTVGFSCRASRTASAPSPASPTTVMSASSSRIRRKPRRTRL